MRGKKPTKAKKKPNLEARVIALLKKHAKEAEDRHKATRNELAKGCALTLTNVQPVQYPVLVRGQQGIWYYPHNQP